MNYHIDMYNRINVFDGTYKEGAMEERVRVFREILLSTGIGQTPVGEKFEELFGNLEKEAEEIFEDGVHVGKYLYE